MKKLRILLTAFVLLAAATSFQSCKENEMGEPLPSTQADFTYEGDNEYFAPSTVQFTNQSLLATGYSWDFGNGETSSQENPSITYQEPGNYNVKLTVNPTHDVHYNNLVKEKVVVIKDPLALPKKTLYFTERANSTVKYTVLDDQPPVVQQFSHTGLVKPYGAVIDTVNDKVYVSDYSQGLIFRYNLDGSGLETIIDGSVDPNAEAPLGLIIIEEKLYWAHEFGIYRSNLDGSNSEVFLDMSSGAPEMAIDLAYDPENEVMYFTNDKYDYSGGVYAVNMDGSGLTQLVEGTDGGAIDIDLETQTLYYADYLKGVCMYDINTGIETVISTEPNGTFVWGLALDVEAGYLYWSDKALDKIVRSNLDGSNPIDWITGVDPHAIAIDKPR